MLIKKLYLLSGFGLSFLASTFYCQAKTQTIEIKNMTNKNLIIQIIRPEQKPCQSIQEAIPARETRKLLISSSWCPLVQFKVIGSAENSEKIVNQLTFGTYTRFLIELNQSGDDIIVSPFTAQEQSWHRREKQARERLEREKEIEKESYIKQA